MKVFIEGSLVHGLGRAADFTQIDWVRRQLIELAGIDPHPGTLNLALEDEANRRRWRQWRDLPAATIEPAEINFCRARCYPVRISGRIPAVVLLPQSEDYPENKVELVAAVPLRKQLSLDENARIRVDLCRPLTAKAMLFDIDGTLVDSVAAYVEVAQGAAEAFGLKVSTEQVRRALATGRNFLKDVVPQDQRDRDTTVKELSAHAIREWPRVLQEHAKVFEGLAETLDALKALGIRLGIVSGARSEVLELLRVAGILDRFESIVLGSDVAKGKPDPEGILKCLRQLDVAPAETIYIGDTPVDIQASHAAGVRVVGVLSGAGDSAMLSRHGPDRLVSSHTQLPALMLPS